MCPLVAGALTLCLFSASEEDAPRLPPVNQVVQKVAGPDA